MKKIGLLLITAITIFSCTSTKNAVVKNNTKKPFVWENANVYFLLIDRFNNGNPNNDNIIPRNQPTGKLRGFEGGDLRGIINKIDENYFTKLGITAIWMTPVVEQIHGSVDEGTGNTYGFHGYWTKDWTAIDPSYGTKADLKELVDKAHAKGIRIILDAVINHTGPVTNIDPVWPSTWVRTAPKCQYTNYQNTIECTLVENLPDVRTESNENVELPPMLVEKWKKEGRYEEEVAELEAFFEKTGYPRAPKYYIMKWLADYILDFGIDGYRADTVKHTTEDVWKDFQAVCQMTFDEYKTQNPDKVLDNNPFFTVAEVYGYSISNKKLYDFSDKQVDYFANGFKASINFEFRSETHKPYEELFTKYNSILQNDLKGYSVMNYISSHDDGHPFDKKREHTIASGTKLLLTPGIAQVYYGDETARSLDIAGTVGDATLRSFMNWDELEQNKYVLQHWQKLGQFRANHPAIGTGIHSQISASPYVFSRVYHENNINDKVVIALDVPLGTKQIPVETIFKDGDILHDAYSGKTATVKNGMIQITTDYTFLLLELK